MAVRVGVFSARFTAVSNAAGAVAHRRSDLSNQRSTRRVCTASKHAYIVLSGALIRSVHTAVAHYCGEHSTERAHPLSRALYRPLPTRPTHTARERRPGRCVEHVGWHSTWAVSNSVGVERNSELHSPQGTPGGVTPEGRVPRVFFERSNPPLKFITESITDFVRSFECFFLCSSARFALLFSDGPTTAWRIFFSDRAHTTP